MKKKEEIYLIIRPIIEKVFGIKLKCRHIYKFYNNKIWIRFYRQSINIDGQRVLLNTEVEVDLCDEAKLFLIGRYVIKSTESVERKLFSGSFFLLKPYFITGNYSLIYHPWYCEEKKTSYFYKDEADMFFEHVNNKQKEQYQDDSISYGNIMKKI